MAILSQFSYYSRNWEEYHRNPFDEEDIKNIERITVVAGVHGISAKIELSNEEKDAFVPIHRDSKPLVVGDQLDPKKCTIIYLKRGEARTKKLLYQD